MTDADKVVNLQYFGSGPADIWIRIQINPDSNNVLDTEAVFVFG